ncbi:MAG: PD40 domain-containing protein [Bacteroidetes bacterium]|nr:PD40 domain-containing protein [Bacteroidota bacterium]
MNADGSNIENLTMDAAEDYSPDWSPDGEWIAYTSGTSAQYDVWIIHTSKKRSSD